MNSLIVLFAIWTVSCHIAVIVSKSAFFACIVAAIITISWRLILLRTRQNAPEFKDEIPAIAEKFTPLLSILTSREVLLFTLTALLLASSILSVPFFLYGLVVVGIAYFSSLFRKSSLHVSGSPEKNENHERTSSRSLFFLCSIFALVALATNRPDLDDSYHLNIAQIVASNLQAPLYQETRLYYGEPTEFWLPIVWKWQTLYPLIGCISAATQIDPLWIAHFALPPLGAIFVVLSYFSLFKELSPKNSLSLTAITMLVLLTLGNSNIGFGNFGGFVRLHHGIGLFLTAGIPLISACTIRLIAKPTRARFFELTALNIAAVGLSATALIAAPILITITVISQSLFTSGAIHRMIIASASHFYLLLLSFFTILTTADPKGGDAYAPTDIDINGWLYASMYLVMGPIVAMFPQLFLSLVGWIGADTARAARLCIGAPLTAIIFVFNPIAIRILSQCAIVPQVYYRLTYVLHVPVLIAYALLGITQNLSDVRRITLPVRLALCIGGALVILRLHCTFTGTSEYPTFDGFLTVNFIILLGVVGIVWPTLFELSPKKISQFGAVILFFTCVPYQHVLNSNNALFGARLSFGIPTKKVPAQEFEIAKLITSRISKDQTVLAPTRIAGWITTFKNNPRPLVSTSDLLPSSKLILTESDYLLREALQRFIEKLLTFSTKEEISGLLRRGFDTYPIGAIAFYRSRGHLVDQELLKERGLVQSLITDEFEVWIKQPR